MNDLGLKVIIGTSWVFAVLNLAPDIIAAAIERGALPLVGDLAPNVSEAVYVGVLVLLVPVAMIAMSMRSRRRAWARWEDENTKDLE